MPESSEAMTTPNGGRGSSAAVVKRLAYNCTPSHRAVSRRKVLHRMGALGIHRRRRVHLKGEFEAWRSGSATQRPAASTHDIIDSPGLSEDSPKWREHRLNLRLPPSATMAHANALPRALKEVPPLL